MSELIFVCGTRRVQKRAPGDYRVVCATCGGGGTVRYHLQSAAESAAVRASARPCPVNCGAR